MLETASCPLIDYFSSIVIYLFFLKFTFLPPTTLIKFWSAEDSATSQMLLLKERQMYTF